MRLKHPTWRRLGAFCIDYIIVGLPAFIITIGLFNTTGGRFIPVFPFKYSMQYENVVEENKTIDSAGREVTNQTVVIKVVHYFRWAAYSIEHRRIIKDGSSTSTYTEAQTAIFNEEDGKIYPATVFFSDEYIYVLLFIYWTIFDASRWSATPGKRYLKMRIIDYDGRKLTLSRSAARNLLKIPSILVLMIGCIMIFFTKRNQGFHDLVAKALVIDDMFSAP